MSCPLSSLFSPLGASQTRSRGPSPLTPGSSHPQDPHLDKFFTLVHVLEEGAFPFRLKDGVLSEGTVEQELRASLAALRLASPEPLVAFSHHVLDKLVRLVVRPPIIGGQIGEQTRPQTSVYCLENGTSVCWSWVTSSSPFISQALISLSER